MKVLFIGGTGVISTAVSKLAIERGFELYILNRGKQSDKLPQGATFIQGDITKPEEIRKALEGMYFDAVVQWISFTVDHVKRDYNLFHGFTKQFVFISSASAYFKPIPYLPITEAIPLGNVYWEYSENKKKCEEYLLSVHNPNFNVTIIRPSHTYNDEMLISQLKSRTKPYTLIKRMLENKPIILPDGGTSLWTLTYNQDFASGFLDVLGNEATYGEFYHLTGDKVYTWQKINEDICLALGVSPNIINIPADYILTHFPEFKAELYGDKLESAVFDNSKIKRVAKNWKSITEYSDIAKKAVQRLLNNPDLQEVDMEFDKRYDDLIEDYKASL